MKNENFIPHRGFYDDFYFIYENMRMRENIIKKRKFSITLTIYSFRVHNSIAHVFH